MVCLTTTLTTLTLALSTAAAAIGPRAHAGQATWFYPGLGACGNNHGDNDLIAAASPSLLNSKRNCGRRIRVHGPRGTAVVTLVDLCPVCPRNNVDLSPAAFKAVVGELGAGRARVTWAWV